MFFFLLALVIAYAAAASPAFILTQISVPLRSMLPWLVGPSLTVVTDIALWIVPVLCGMVIASIGHMLLLRGSKNCRVVAFIILLILATALAWPAGVSYSVGAAGLWFPLNLWFVSAIGLFIDPAHVPMVILGLGFPMIQWTMMFLSCALLTFCLLLRRERGQR